MTTILCRTFPSIEAFYAADERRRLSPEHDFGCWWVEGPTWQRYRVSWVEATGEVYAIRATAEPAPLELLAVIPDEADLTARLRGWADVCGARDSLAWVRRRLGAVPAGKDAS